MGRIPIALLVLLAGRGAAAAAVAAEQAPLVPAPPEPVSVAAGSAAASADAAAAAVIAAAAAADTTAATTDPTAAAATTTATATRNDDVGALSDTLTSLLSASDQHGTFLHLLQRAKLVPMLGRMNGTVFAPTNAAWKAWDDAHRPPDAALAADRHDAPRAFGWLGPRGLDEWLLPESEAQAQLARRVAAAPHDEHLLRAEADNQNWALRQHLLFHVLNYTVTAADWARHGAVGTTIETTMLYPLLDPPDPPRSPDPGSPWIPGPVDGLLGTHGQRLRVARPRTKPAVCGKRGCVGFDHRGDRGAPVWDGSGWNSTDGDGTHHATGDDKQEEPVGVRWGRNGAVIGLDAVLEPPKGMVETLRETPELSYLAHLLSSPTPLPPPLPAWIDRTSHVTLFAGSDTAFSDKFDDIERGYLEGMFGAEGLGRVLAPGLVLTLDSQVGWSDTWKKKPTNVPSVSGVLEVARTDDAGLTVNGTAADVVDIFTSNGVIHVLPSLLLPDGFELLNSAEKVLLSRNATRFVSLLRAANLSAEYIGEPGKNTKSKWTILAPIDDAIEYMSHWGAVPPVGSSAAPETAEPEPEASRSWLSVFAPKVPPDTPLAQLLKYHIIPGRVNPSDLEDSSLLSTELRTPALGGERQRLHVEVSDRMQSHSEWDLEDGEIRFGGAMVLGAPVKVGQSVIYFISALLQPPLDVLQTAVADLQLSTYIAAVYAAGLEHLINKNVGTTFFIPRNRAFSQLGLTMKYLLLPDARDELRRMIRYLAVEKLIYTPDVEDGKTVFKTMHGGNVVLHRDAHNKTFGLLSPTKWAGHDSGAGLPANGDLRPARMTAHDALAETGVIHIIDSVVLPADMAITPAKLMRGSKQRTMGELMVKAGLGWILDGREPTLAELERVGLQNSIRPRPQADDDGDGDGAGGDDDAPDPNDFAFPSYTILMPTDKAFSHLNLTHYLSDDKALLDLLKLHIIPSNLDGTLPKASVEHAPRHPPRDGLPLALEDDVVYPTLLAPTMRYGELAFRAWGDGAFVVGVHNARGGSSDRGGRTSAAGRASVRWRRNHKDVVGVLSESTDGGDSGGDPDPLGLWRGGMTLGGGVVVIDTVLLPYDPGWYERWGFLVLTVFGLTAGVALLGVSVWWWFVTTRRRREGYERVAAEEERREQEREQEQANRSWRRMSRSEAQRPPVPPQPGSAQARTLPRLLGFNRKGKGKGTENGNGTGHGSSAANGNGAAPHRAERDAESEDYGDE